MPLAAVVVAVQPGGHRPEPPDLVMLLGAVGNLARQVQDDVELGMGGVLPALGGGDGLGHVGCRAPALLGCLVQVAGCQVLPARYPEIAGLGPVVGCFFGSDVVMGSPLPAGGSLGARGHLALTENLVTEVFNLGQNPWMIASASPRPA